jgi:hypothetical protein
MLLLATVTLLTALGTLGHADGIWYRSKAVVAGISPENYLGSAGAAKLQNAGSSAAAPAQNVVVLHNTPVAVTSGSAQLMGHLDPSQMLRVVVGLQPPNLAEEQEFVAQLQTKDSSLFHQYLTAEQWNARFAPAAEDEQAVVDWAQSQGLTVTQRYDNRLIVDLEGPSASIEKAFGVTLNRYQIGGATYFSNDRDASIPASLGGIIHAIIGLNNIQRLHSQYGVTAPGPMYVSGPVKATLAPLQSDDADGQLNSEDPGSNGPSPDITNNRLDPTDIWNSNAYDTNALYHLGHCCNPLHNPGNSPPDSSIAIAGAYGYLYSDMSGFQKQYPYLTYNIQPYNVDGTWSCPSGQPTCTEETTLDVEWAVALSNSRSAVANTAKIYMYQGVDPTLGTFTDIFNYMLSEGYARVMSTSWGCAEIDCVDTGTMDTDDNIFTQMVGQGWTLVAAAGDNGATAGIPNPSGAPNLVCDSRDRVEFPASDGNVIAAGGTTLVLGPTGTYLGETGWTGNTSPGSCNSNRGGGGGGCSAYFGRPGYQTDTNCHANGAYSRAVPDIALNANSGQNIFYQGKLIGVGGTSIVAPEVAGFFAQENAYLDTLGSICGITTGTSPCAPLGNANYVIYIEGNKHNAPHDPFYDITSGCNSNDVTAALHLHYYCAGKGFDQVTGWGSFNMLQLAWAINYNVAADTGAPTIKFSGPKKNHWFDTDQTVSWTVTDTGGKFRPTGVAGYTDKWDEDPGDETSEATPGQGNTFYSGPAHANETKGSLTVAAAGQGCHTANVYAWDNMGLPSGDQTYGPVCYDTVDPKTSYKQSPAADSYGWNNSAVTVTLTAEDPGAPATGSGVEHTYYALDDLFCSKVAIAACTVYSGPFKITATGAHTLYFLSNDKAGNYEYHEMQPVNIDETAPVTKASLSGALSGGKYSSAVKVTLTATDDLSGVKKTAYQLNGAALETYGGAFTVSELGANTVEFHSTDKADNVEANKSVTFTIQDATATSLLSSTNPAILGESVTFTATVTSSVGTATGNVTFLDGSTNLGTATLSAGVATFTTATLAVGTHSITAMYAGATNILASTSPVLTQVVLDVGTH